MRRVRLAAAGLLIVSAAGTTIGLAAGTALTAQRLTVHSGSATVPLQRCSLTAVADADVDVVNTGTATTLRVRSSNLGDRRAFVRFDLSACGLGADDDVRIASLSLVLGTAPGTSRMHELRRVTGAWTETAVTSLNQPTVAGAVTDVRATGTTGSATLTWNVLADVQAFRAGTINHGWRLSDGTEGAATAAEGIYQSRESATAANRPTLTIDYYP